MEGTENIPSKKAKLDSKRACQVGYCPGSVDMIQIPQGIGRATILMDYPFNWSKSEVDAAPALLFVCRSHLQSYACGSSKGHFVMHPISDDPVVKGMLNGEIMPQPDFLARTEQTYVTFLSRLQSRVDRANHFREPVSTSEPPTSRQRRSFSSVADNADHEEELNKLRKKVVADEEELNKLRKKVAELQAELTTTNKSYGRVLSDCKKQNGVLKTNNDLLQAKVKELEARVTQLMTEGAWTFETVLGFSNVDFKAILGLEKEQWSAYLDYLDVHGASALWKHPSVDWRTGYLITQIKLRQNLIYALIKIIFKVPAATCSTIFKSCVQFSAAVAILVLDVDSREYSCLYRLDGITYDHNGVRWTKIKFFTDANEVPVEAMNNEEANSKGYSDYYGDARLKHQAVLNEAGELFWASVMYLPKGACDQELLKNGVSLAAGGIDAKKVYDLMQGLLRNYIRWYVVRECFLQAYMYLYVFM